MRYELTDLKEHRIFVFQPSWEEGRNEFSINWSFSIGLDMPSRKTVVVSIDVKINVENPADHPPIANFIASHSFTVDAFQENLFELEQREQALGFFATLVGVSLGTMRGLSYARTHGILGPRVVMPVVNPSELLRPNFPKMLAAIGEKWAKI
jgi:pimeloyl-ACP methyl ester carboxylesterase